MAFNDHFSLQSAAYASYRPHYPESLFSYLSQLVSPPITAWDCATGNGQVALGLVPYCDRIYATDASAKQISHAFASEKITYAIAPAETSGLAAQSVDLITVGQALHWFNLDQFYDEVRRVLTPGGVLAVWGYGLFTLPQAGAELLAAIDRFYALVEPFWPPERVIIEQGYRKIPFPFVEVTPPQLTMQVSWSAEQLVGYLRTWSATQRCVEALSPDEVVLALQVIRESWGAATQQLVDWPLHFRLGYHA